tara:strand:+ start:10142 stop:10360 length:219 start_codon:yes stop_codon:yes gene_type:complete
MSKDRKITLAQWADENEIFLDDIKAVMKEQGIRFPARKRNNVHSTRYYEAKLGVLLKPGFAPLTDAQKGILR